MPKNLARLQCPDCRAAGSPEAIVQYYLNDDGEIDTLVCRNCGRTDAPEVFDP